MPDQLHNIRVAFSVINCICYDQRVLKIASTVNKLDCDITIIGRRLGACCNSNLIPFKTKRFRMIFRRGFLFYSFFNLRLLFYLLLNKFDILVSNDLDTLLPNYLVSKLKGVPLVYDSHEYFTETPEIQNRPFVKWVWKSIEKITFPNLKYVMTVSEPIASIYEKLYLVRPLVVRNFSKKANHLTSFLREKLGVKADYLLLVIQGNGINIDKGAEELVDAVYLIDKVALLVVGSGDVVPELKLKVKDLNMENRVKFIQSVPWESLMKYTKSADIGICLEKDTNLNYKYCLPNKLFDYIAAGIPVIASDLPETGKIINENRCGIIIDDVTPEKIVNAISELKINKNKLEELRINAVTASEKLNWEIESEKVKEFYSQILNNL